MKAESKSKPQPVGLYVPCIKTGNLLLTSGALPLAAGEIKYAGKVGRDFTLEQGQEAAKLCLENALTALRDKIGDLNHIKQFIRLNGYINSAAGFSEQHKVLNAASEVLIKQFGEKGKHTRIAIGVAELPLNAAVELDLIVEV